MKTSIRDEEDIKETFNQIKARDIDFVIEGVTKKITSLILLCHEDNIVEVIKVYQDLIKNNTLILERPLAFLTWRVGKDTGDVENYYVKYHSGSVSNPFIDEVKKDPIKKPVYQAILKSEQERFYFTNVKPRPAYMNVRFKLYINQKIKSLLMKPIPQEIVNIGPQNDLIKDFKEKLGNALVFPRSRWIKESLSFFEKQGWLSCKDDGSIEVYTKKFRSSSIGNDELKKFSRIDYYEELARRKRREKKD